MIRVFLVDDEALAQELHALYVSRMAGFEVVAQAQSAQAAAAAIIAAPDRYDLVLLDMTMPDGDGLAVLRAIRAAGVQVDVIAVTAVRDVNTVHQMVSLGVVNYLVKPFSFATFRDRLEAYRTYREQTLATTGAATQSEIDALLGALRPSTPATLPKGLSPETLRLVTTAIRDYGPLSSQETADQLGISRVVARRYLEHLVTEHLVTRSPRYGSPGRPESEYRWGA